MSPDEVETVYEAMARQIDAVGAEHSELFLAKLALLLAERLDDTGAALDAIASAAVNLAR